MSQPQPSDPATARETERRLDRAFGILGCTTRAWKQGVSTVTRNDQAFPVSIETLSQQLPIEVSSAEPDELAFAISGLLGIPLPDALAFDFDQARPWLRPRIVGRQRLTGPDRAMCRRDAFGPLLKAVTLGLGERAPFVTTRVLDRWPVEFDDVLTIAIDNLRRSVDPDSLLEIDGDSGVHAVVSDLLPGSSACLVIDSLLPRLPPGGVVFSVPVDDACLLMPVDENATVDSLAVLIQSTLTMMQDRQDAISDQLFWKRGGGVDHIHLTMLEEGSQRRAHIEATAVMRQLLRELGGTDDALLD